MITNNLPHKNLTYARGLTLVELMIAMVLSLVLIGGIFRVLDSNKTAYRVTEAQSRVQENGRFALNFLVNDIRSADYWGCLGNSDKATNRVSASLSNLDGISIGNNTGANGTDTITLRGANNAIIKVTAATGATITVEDASQLAANDYVLVSNCEVGDIVKINSISNKVLTVNTSDIKADNYANSKASVVVPIQQKVYSISANNELQLNGDTLAEGVQNLQIQYVVDSNNDGVADSYLDAPSSAANIIGLKLNLLVRSLENNVTTQAQTYDFNGSSATATDNRLYRTLSTIVTLRNRIK